MKENETMFSRFGQAECWASHVSLSLGLWVGTNGFGSWLGRWVLMDAMSVAPSECLGSNTVHGVYELIPKVKYHRQQYYSWPARIIV